MHLNDWLTAAGVAVSLIAAAVAAYSAFYARRQADSAKKSAEAAEQMAETDTDRRHDELTPKWDTPVWKSTSGESWQLCLRLRQGQLDHLVIEIYDSPDIRFDVSRQADVVADRAERHEAMSPGSAVLFWVYVAPGHERKLRLRVTAGLAGREWQPTLLPELDVVV
ncbi:hypothetical protein [Nocardia sp. NPDC051981]|uniref:hypothetical protein n=1 Tax=Nocardia sp. NPDC051981 TaxID=3155417 RepID=UPI003444A6EB